jgi:BED zinc finger
VAFFDVKNAEACTCRMCTCEAKKPKGNTSNLTRHLERHHWREYQEYNCLTKLREKEEKRQEQEPERKQPTLSETFKRATSNTANDARVKKFNCLLVNLICVEGLPLSILESAAFKMFVSALDPPCI